MKNERKTSILRILWVVLVVCVFIGLVYFIHFQDPIANKMAINLLALSLMLLPIIYVGYYHFFNAEYAILKRGPSILHIFSSLITSFYLAINFTDLPAEGFLLYYFGLGIFSIFLFLGMFYKIDKAKDEELDELIDSIGEEGE